MSYITYGVKVVCISNKNEETEEFLFHEIDPNQGVSDVVFDYLKDDKYWIEYTADLIAQKIEFGEIKGDVNDIENDWKFIVTYGVFQIKVQGNRLALA